MPARDIRSLLTSIYSNYEASSMEWADHWLTMGAEAVAAVQADGTILTRWPLHPRAGLELTIENSAATAPLTMMGQTIAQLCVYGELPADAGIRLCADAKLLSMILSLEYDAKTMTNDIIDHQDRLMALNQIAQHARGHSTLDHSTAVLSDIAARSLHTEHAFLMVETPANGAKIGSYPGDPDLESGWLTLIAQLTTEREDKQWYLTDKDECIQRTNLAISNAIIRKMTVRPGLHLYMGVANKQDGPFLGPELKLFETITAPTAAIIRNTIQHHETLRQTRIQAEVELATRVQMSLLPQAPPNIPEIEIAARSIPATEVGGDFYDFSVCKDLLSFNLGDVSGKGMGAALFMAMLRTVLRGKSREEAKEPAPGEILEYANSLLYADFSEVGMFATVFQAQYDTNRHVLHFANAGHAPVIYRPVRESSRMLEAENPPLGILPDHDSVHQSLFMEPGDLIVVASDGLTEAEREDGAMFGYDQLIDLVDELAQCSAAEIAEQIFARIDSYAGQQAQSDDQTLIVLKRRNSYAE